MDVIHFSITLGNIIEILVLVIGGITFLTKIVSEFTELGREIATFNDKFKDHGNKIEKVEKSIEKLTEITSQIAIQEAKIVHLENYMDTQSKQTSTIIESLQHNVADLTSAIAELIEIKKNEVSSAPVRKPRKKA